MSAPYHRLERADWNPARVSHLCDLLGDGGSFAVIAASLGMSRNAAVGKFDRLRGEFVGRMSKAGFCDRLADGAALEEIADEASVSFGAAEAMLAQVRRELGKQAR